MGRITKQIIYGAGYLIFFGLVGFLIYFGLYRNPPSCFDNKLNQDEIGIDCGGGCIPCELKDLEVIFDPVQVLDAGPDKVTLFSSLQNPSFNYGVEVFYRFDVFGAFVGKIDSISGRTILEEGERDFIVSPGLNLRSGDIDEVTLTFTDVNWYLDEPVPFYSLALDDIQTTIDDNVQVTGIIFNNEPVKFPVVRLTALLRNQFGDVVHASTFTLENLEAFGEANFVIFFPRAELLQNFDPQSTFVSFEAFRE